MFLRSTASANRLGIHKVPQHSVRAEAQLRFADGNCWIGEPPDPPIFFALQVSCGEASIAVG